VVVAAVDGGGGVTLLMTEVLFLSASLRSYLHQTGFHSNRSSSV